MNIGRPTIDPKEVSIRVRVNEEMRNWLFQNSEKQKKSVSQIIRDLISQSMKNKDSLKT